MREERRRCKLVVGKIHISRWVKEPIEERFSKLVYSGDEYHQETGKGKGRFTWVIADALVETNEGEKIIFARLGKIKQELVETIYDREQKSFIKEKTKSPKALSYSNFIIHPKSSTIVFEEKLPDISIKQFKEIFSMLYKRHFRDISYIKIDLKKETEKVFEMLARYDRVVKVHLKLTPTNPEDEPDFRRLDQVLKEGNIREANIEFENEDEGLKLEKTIVGEGISLSGAGYGEYRITVEKEEKREIIKSKDQILRKVILAVDEPKELIKAFGDKMKEYLKRGQR